MAKKKGAIEEATSEEVIVEEIKKEQKPEKKGDVSPEAPKLTASLVDIVAQDALQDFEEMIKIISQNSMNVQHLPKLKKILDNIKFVIKAKA